MRSAAGRLESLAYWVASDHFVELGEAERLFHGGFGLLTIGNLRKPRFWAIALLERLGEHELASDIDGDGAGSLVEAWASGDPDGRVAIAVWNGTLDQADLGREPCPRSVDQPGGRGPAARELRTSAPPRR
jgi:xylan 1,4-beta-xylosidase